MSDDLGMKIAKLLLTEEPGLLVADMGANAKACLALADNLGSLMAALKVKKGQAYYEQAAKLVFQRIDEAAKDVNRKAHAFAAEGAPASH